MAEGRESVLRRWALVLFAVIITLDVLDLLLSDNLAGRAALRQPFHVDVGNIADVATLAVLGLVLSWVKPRVSIGWLLSATGLVMAVLDAGGTYGMRALAIREAHLPLGAWALALTAGLWIPSLLMPGTVILIRYPSGRIHGRWARRIDRCVIAGFVLVWLGYSASDSAVGDAIKGGTSPLRLPVIVQAPAFALGALLLLGGLASVVIDAVRRMVKGERAERLALLWLLATAVIAVLVAMLGSKEWLSSVAYPFQLVAIAVGALRYGALGIEVVVRRTLLYATLTGLVLAVFVGLVAVLAQLIPSGPGPQIVAAAVIAVGLAPARDRLQRIIDRLLYGERADPLAALRRLGAPLTSVPAHGALLDDVVAALAEGLRLPAAVIETADGGVLAMWRDSAADASEAIPLSFGGEQLGNLRVATRSGERELGRADRTLLDSVAPLIAAIVRSSQLATDLEAERNRVLDATRSERARLRQELHDGLGPSLTGIGLGLDAARSSPLAGDPRTAELVSRLRSEVTSSLEEIRRIIDDLRPTVLDEHDLVAALRARGERVTSGAGVTVAVEGPASLPDLPPEIETAAFRIADEALTNVVRHAHARSCTVRVSVTDCLRLVVSDDGVGVGAGRAGGFGLTSMRQRAERIGGRFLLTSEGTGTSVIAELPLAVIA